MSASAFLTGLLERGVKVRPDGDNLLIDAPSGVLTELDRAALRKFKPDILGLLRDNVDGPRSEDDCQQSDTKPFLDSGGDLHIPFQCPPRYHWWAGGQSIAVTLIELNAPSATWERYIPRRMLEALRAEGKAP